MVDRITKYRNGVPTIPHGKITEACRRLAELEDLKEQGRLFSFPVGIGSKVYEVIADERFEPYIAEYEVTDVSVKGVEYAGDWASWGYCNLYFDRKTAEMELGKLMEMERMFDE